MYNNQNNNTNIENDEIERPLQGKEDFPLSTTANTKVNRDVFNTVKGHNLLGWCIAILFLVYLIEKFFGDFSEVGKSIIEILKMLIFSLSGYLFGSQSNNNN